MRRIVTLLLSTITVLVLLFSYHTSTDSGSPSVVAAPSGGAATAPPGHAHPLGHDPRTRRRRPRHRDDGAGDDGGTDHPLAQRHPVPERPVAERHVPAPVDEDLHR